MNWRAIMWGAVAGCFGGALVSVAVDWKLEWAILKGKWDCWGAPSVVPFHQGMMLCPGQSATMTIVVPIPVEKKDEGI